MTLASHFHHEITLQGFTSLLIAVAGLVALFAALRLRWRARLPLGVVGLALGIFGGYRLAEAFALSHNHLCHAHSSDSCSGNESHDQDGHTHRFGSRAAKPED